MPTKGKKRLSHIDSPNSTFHTGNQPSPPSSCMREHRYNAKVSNGTLNFTVGTAQKRCASDLGKCKDNPIGGDGWIDAIWMDDKHSAELACLGRSNDKC